MSQSEQSRDTAQEPRRGNGTGSGDSPEGRLLAGRYRLGGVLGRGGMGTVWRALDETLGRAVAVKELRFPSSIDDDEKRRLITRTLREAKAIARIRNSGAVTVFDVVDEDDRPWIVMELIEGKSLAEAVREDGNLTPRRAAEVGLAVLDVLRSAHCEGILHRDVKPSNVLIAEDGRVVLTDFGIAQVEGDPSVTSTGMLVGAPSYISPERARGHKPGPAADLWSLGGLLYASVEGSPPYDKSSAIATLTAVMTEPLEPPRNAGALTEVIYGLLVKDPAQRLDDAGARALLQDVIDTPETGFEPPLDATRVGPVPPPVPPMPSTPPDDLSDRTAPRPAEPPTPAEHTPAVSAAPAEHTPAVSAAPAGPVKSATSAAGSGGDRPRGARHSARNAVVPAESAMATASPSEPRPGPSPRPAAPAPPSAAPRASLTQVATRRTVVIIAVVAAVALISTVLAIALSGGDGSDEGAKKGTTASAATGSGAEEGGGADGTTGSPDVTNTPAKGGKGAATEGTQGSGSDDSDSDNDGGSADKDGATGLPDGYGTVSDDRFHFSMAMPEVFRRTQIAGTNSGGIYNRSRDAFPRIQVDFNDSPTDDALSAWRGLEPAVGGSSSGYKLLGIKKADYKGYPTVADWEFERKQGGQRIRVLNRGFKIDSSHGYSIMVSCKASQWDSKACVTLRKTAFETFEPQE
jgi:eukaryotic-like serine/threonine-protein kinase